MSPQQFQIRVRKLTALLLCLWLLTILAPTFYARELSESLPGWPLHYWISAQGALLIFLLLVVVYAVLVNRWEARIELQTPPEDDSNLT